MKIMTLADMRRLGVGELKSAVPMIVSLEGEPLMVLANKDEVIVLSDLHPRVQTQLRAAEQRARAGMPKPQKVFIEDLRKTPQES